jgi:hypothetical protein
VRGDHLPASLSFHPRICGSVSAIDIVASSLDSDDETVAHDSHVAVNQHLYVFLIVRCHDLLSRGRGTLPLGRSQL